MVYCLKCTFHHAYVLLFALTPNIDELVQKFCIIQEFHKNLILTSEEELTSKLFHSLTTILRKDFDTSMKNGTNCFLNDILHSSLIQLK